jgi:hypothetical protein
VSYLVEVSRDFQAQQGLPSPVRRRRALPPTSTIDVTLRVAVTFDDDQLTDQGWFLDTDAVAELLDTWAARLADGPWTTRFPFRPTFELVARHLFADLSPRIPQLSWLELEDRTFGTRTRYAMLQP